MLDGFVVLRHVAQIQDAARCLFQQIHRQIDQVLGAAHFHPRHIRFLEHFGHGFKRAACFADEQNMPVVARGVFQLFVQFFDNAAVTQIVADEHRLCLRFAVFEGAFHRLQQFLQRNGFFQKIQRADFGRFHGGVDAAVAAHHHHGHGEQAAGRPFFQQGNAVAVRHPNIQQNQGRAQLNAHFARFFGIFRAGNGIAFVFQCFLQYFTNTDFVINN